MWQNFPMCSCSAEFIRCWWIGRAFFRPWGITVHSYSPKGVVTTVSGMLSGCTCVWKKELVISNLLQIFPLVQSVRMSSTHGRGYESSTVFAFRAQGIRRSNSTSSFVRLNQCLPGILVFMWAWVRSCSYSFRHVLQFNVAIHVCREIFSVRTRFKNGTVSPWNFGPHLVELILCCELF